MAQDFQHGTVEAGRRAGDRIARAIAEQEAKEQEAAEKAEEGDQWLASRHDDVLEA
jgi:hypothetical protein